MDEAIAIGILCLLLLIAVVYLLGNRVTPRLSNSIQESGEDDPSENHRMDVFSQERFPLIKKIQNTIQLIYQRCRWKSYRISTVSTQTDPCGPPDQTFVQRPLATNLSDSLTPQSIQSRHATEVASYREATRQTPNPETNRISETEVETNPPRHEATVRQTTEAVTDMVTDPPRHEAIARQTAEAVTASPQHEAIAKHPADAVTDEVADLTNHEAIASQTAEAVMNAVTDPPRHEATARQTTEAVTDEGTDSPRHKAITRQTTEALMDEITHTPRHEAIARQTTESVTDEGTDPPRHEAIVRQTTEAVMNAVTDPPRHEATARQTAEAEMDEVTDKLRHKAIARQRTEAVTDEVTDKPNEEAIARQRTEAVTDEVTDPPRHKAIARQRTQAVTDEVTDSPRHEAIARQIAEAETDEVTDPPRHEAIARQTAEAEMDEVTNPPRHKATARQTTEAMTDEVTDAPRHKAIARQTAEAVMDEVTDPPNHEAIARQTTEAIITHPQSHETLASESLTAVKNAVIDPPRHEVIARKRERATTMAVSNQERSDMTAKKVSETVKNPSSHHTIKRGTTETNAGALNDVTYQKSISDGHVQNDIDIHQSTRHTEDLCDEPPAGNKEAGIWFKEQAINLKPVSKKGSADTGNNEMSLNDKENLNLLCDSETSSSRSCNSPELTEEEESPKGHRWTTDQSEITLSKSEPKSKLEMVSQNCHHNILVSTQHSDIFTHTKLGNNEDGQDLKASQRARKTQVNMFLENNADQGMQQIMSGKEDTSMKYKLSQSKTTRKAENTYTEKELSTLSKPNQIKKHTAERDVTAVVSDMFPSDSVTVKNKQRRSSQRRDEAVARSINTVSDLTSEIYDYDADNEYSSSDAESENNAELSSYAKQKRPLSAHEDCADGNMKQSSREKENKKTSDLATNLGTGKESKQDK
ncbi:extracellular matrix-binding protein ebh-like [Haliotis asinina]|uniref:extracellular matrix-binding protein ebh-like n=1 Tax=Haliotis asinina TaxID=109174 RepID=UPI0035326BC7